MSNRREIHDRVLQAADKGDLASAYSEWASTYDADLVDEMGYRAFSIASDLLIDQLQSSGARILDAGCGTGLVGSYLTRAGYASIDGLDYSADMLAQAQAKSVYTNLLQGDMTTTLAIPDDCYDAVICVGTFTLGHVGPGALGELVRVTRPGGYVCFTVRDAAWLQHEYARHIDELSDEGLWELLESRQATYIEDEGSMGQVVLCRVTDAAADGP